MTIPPKNIHIIPVLNDNYTFVITSGSAAAIIDPGDAAPIIAACELAHIRPSHILCTHHHGDHIAGLDDLLQKWPDLIVASSLIDAPRIPQTTLTLLHNDTLNIGPLHARVIEVGCHTRGHVAFLFDDALFCGDTLFLAGCGRFFEGNAADMLQALSRLRALPPSTHVYCGHEYSLANLAFACAIEPDNTAATQKYEWARQQRAHHQPTIPSTLAEEILYNPFLRWDQASIQAAVGAQDPVDVLGRVRERRSAFKPPTST